MALEIQSRDRRALMILLAAGALFAVMQLDFFFPSTGSPLVGGSIEGAQERFLDAQVQARQKPLVEAESQEAAKALAEFESGLLQAESAELAKAEMRQVVGNLLVAEGITMRASRFGNVELEQDYFAQVPLTVDFDCRVEQFVNWMTTLSNSERLLTTRRIVLRPTKTETKAVRAQVTVSGYLPVSRTPELMERQRNSTPGGLP